jgi:protein-tyrosine-phosphatase/DNA-binding transcriptional ArsR family regulator
MGPRAVELPEFLQLAGHPLRWRLLGELARSDRIVQELMARTGEPQNLVSYHLGKLREAGIVSARRSSADRRDAYYALDLARVGGLLSATGAAIHPGLKLSPVPREDAAPARVLFLCTGNSARSQMAEALARHLSGGAIEAFSAGSAPKTLHPNAVRVMREDFGLDIAGNAPKHLDRFAAKRFDFVVSLCDRVREVCPEFPGHPETVHWSIANPVTGENDAATLPLFRATAAEIAARMGFLLALFAERTNKKT